MTGERRVVGDWEQIGGAWYNAKTDEWSDLPKASPAAVYVSETGDPTEYVYLGELATFDREEAIRGVAVKIAPEINRLADDLDRHVLGKDEAVKAAFDVMIPELSRVMIRAAMADVFGRVLIPAMREVCGAPLGLGGVAARRLDALT